jgi:hypothetical protein
MQLVVQLKAKHKSPPASVTSAVRACGAEIERMHPGTTDPTLRLFFTVELSTFETAERLATLLLQNAAVDGAYVKPADAIP